MQKNLKSLVARIIALAVLALIGGPAFATCVGPIEQQPEHCPRPAATPATSPVTATGTGTAISGARAGAAANAGATSGSSSSATGGQGGAGGAGGTAGAVAATGPVTAVGGPSQASASGNGAGQQVNFDSYAHSRTYGLALAYSAAPHERDSGSTAAPAVGVVTPSACMPDFEGEGANRKVKKDPIDYPEGAIIEVTNPDGTKRILEGIVREEIILGKRKLSGFGADTKSRAKSETRAGGVLLAHLQGGDSDSEAVGTTGFKSEYQPCPYRVNYYRAKPAPVQQPAAAATGAADSTVKVGVAQTKVAERKAWACWFGDPAKKPAKAKNGASVRQCNVPTGLVEGERVKLLHGDTVTTLESAEGSAGASVAVEAAAKK